MINTQGMTEDAAKAAIRANFKNEFAGAITAKDKAKKPFVLSLIELQGGDGIPAPPAEDKPLTPETPEQELERLRTENAKLKAGNISKGTLALKVSEKGALSVYGLSRFPVTLYREQWVRLLEAKDAIIAFMAANDTTLVWKADKKA